MCTWRWRVPPCCRLHGDLMRSSSVICGGWSWEGYITRFSPTRRTSSSPRAATWTFLRVPRGGRFRVNVYRKDTGIGATFRSIPAEVPTSRSSRWTPIVAKLCDFHQGMVLVTGSTGTASSTARSRE